MCTSGQCTCSNGTSHDTVTQNSKAARHASLNHIPQPYCSCCSSAHKLLSPTPSVTIQSRPNPAILPRPNPSRIPFSVMARSIASAIPIPVMTAPAWLAFTVFASAVSASMFSTPAMFALVVPEPAVPVPVFQLGVLGPPCF